MKTRCLNSKKVSLLLVLSLLSAYIFLCMTRNCFSSAMVFIVDNGLLTKFETGVITAMFYVAYAIMQLFGGVIIDRMNAEHFVTVGLLGAALSNIVIYFNQNYIVMLIAWSFNAVMQFGVWPAVFKIMSTMVVSDMRDSCMYISTLASPAGVVFSYVVAAIVSTRWQLNFLISAVGLVIFALVWELTVRFSSAYAVEVEAVASVKDSEIAASQQVGGRQFGRLIFSSGLILAFVVAFFRAMFDFGIKAMTPTMINESYEAVTPVLATVMNIAVLVAGVLGIMLAHVIYTHFIKNEAVVIAVFFFIAFPLSLCALLLGRINYWIMIIILAFIVMLMGACSLFTTSYLATRFNRVGRGGTVAGIINCTASLGIVFAYTVFPGIADKFGWNGTVILWIIMMAVSLILSLVFVPFWTSFLKKR